MKYKIIKNSKEYDHDSVRWDGSEIGYGFISKDKNDKKIRLVKCPKCRKENYAMAVIDGICVWCGFNANKI